MHSLGTAMVGIVSMYFYCYHSDEITESCYRRSKEIYELRWYEYPMIHQKHLLVVMIDAQRQIRVDGYGFVPCTMTAFVKVGNDNFCFRINCLVWVLFHRWWDRQLHSTYLFAEWLNKHARRNRIFGENFLRWIQMLKKKLLNSTRRVWWLFWLRIIYQNRLFKHKSLHTKLNLF